MIAGSRQVWMLERHARVCDNPLMPEPTADAQGVRITHASFERDGLSFPYLRFGVPEARETVVILHGFSQDLTTWHPIALALSQDANVLLLRQRGYAATNSPRKSVAYRVSELREDVLALLRAEHIGRAHVVGHDLGGLVAWGLARDEPEKFATLTVLAMPDARAVRDLILRTNIYRLWYILAFQLPGFGPLALGLRNGAFAVRLLTRTGLQRETARRYVEGIRKVDTWHSKIFKWYAAYRYNVSEICSRTTIAVPTLLVWGDADSIVRDQEMRRSTKWIEGPYRLHRIAGAGHWLPEDHPADLTEQIGRHISDNSS
jgi:pimeloyl-ACP methyl ester carboxylesterase